MLLSRNATVSRLWRIRRIATKVVPSPTEKKTIYALSTPPGRGGIGVIRISGPDALDVYTQMVRVRTGIDAKAKHKKLAPEPWRMRRCSIVHPESQEVLDEGMAVFFKAPQSFTAEHTVELHTHSGPALLSSILSSLALFHNLRPAQPGEFTKRALLNGRLDLTQVEGIKDLIDAETEEQRKSAVRAVGGHVKREMDSLRDDVIKCLAMLEALIDFGEGEDLEEGVYDQAVERAQDLIRTIECHLSDARRGEIVRSGIKLSIFGPPNAGKSSLLNFLSQRDAAIVTPIPGTTRDILSLSLDIGGLPVIISDTAGLRKTQDVIENIGIERAHQAVHTSDVRLCVLSLSELRNTSSTIDLADAAPECVKPLLFAQNTCVLLNKSDLEKFAIPETVTLAGKPLPFWVVSLTESIGTQAFLDGLQCHLKDRYKLGPDSVSTPPLITRERHRTHFVEALQFLQAFLDTPREEPVLAAEELRYAAQAIAKVTGRIDVENVLDVVFSEFCIGK